MKLQVRNVLTNSETRAWYISAGGECRYTDLIHAAERDGRIGLRTNVMPEI